MIRDRQLSVNTPSCTTTRWRRHSEATAGSAAFHRRVDAVSHPMSGPSWRTIPGRAGRLSPRMPPRELVAARRYVPAGVRRSGEQLDRSPIRTRQRDAGRARHVLAGALGENTDATRTLWVPRTLSPHATCTYSWMRPPSRFRRSGWIAAPEGGGSGVCGRVLVQRSVRAVGVVKSVRGAVSVFRPARFLGPLPEPVVRLSPQRALRKSRVGLPVVMRWPARVAGWLLPGTGSGWCRPLWG
jgi:hypothetical protein